MFPSSTTIDRPARRSVAELMRGAVGTALEFATLGEATLAGHALAQAAPPPTTSLPEVSFREHPHRQALVRPRRPRRDGAVPPRAPVCTAAPR